MSTTLTVNINDETAEAIRHLMHEYNTTATDIVLRAVSAYAYLTEARQHGDEIRLVSQVGTRRIFLP